MHQLLEELREASKWRGPEPEGQGLPDGETWAHWCNTLWARDTYQKVLRVKEAAKLLWDAYVFAETWNDSDELPVAAVDALKKLGPPLPKDFTYPSGNFEAWWRGENA